jgi:hypothetical protein
MQLFSNNYNSQLIADISDSDTIVFVGDVSGLPDISDPENFCVLTLCDSSRYPEEDIEIVKCTEIKASNNSLTVIRGQEGTPPTSHSSGECVSLRLTAKAIEQKTDIGHKHTESDITDLVSVSPEEVVSTSFINALIFGG